MTGAHAAVMAEEAVAALNVRSDGVYVDGTFGRGGHSRLILARLGATGRLIAMDRDPEAVAAAGAIGEVAPRHLSFMGSITRPERLIAEFAPAAATVLAGDGVDIALLVPV